ncbi:MAG: CopD family protein [Persicimonas sp.]
MYNAVVVLHVVAAIIWIGGVLFMGLVAVPAARGLEPRLRRLVTTRLGMAFRPVGWVCLVVLLTTGTYMAINWGATWQNVFDLSFFDAPHTRMLGYKLLAVLAMLGVSFWHDWVIGPRAVEAEPGTEEAERYRRLAGWLGRVTGVLVLVIAVLAVFVARPWA